MADDIKTKKPQKTEQEKKELINKAKKKGLRLKDLSRQSLKKKRISRSLKKRRKKQAEFTVTTLCCL
ncbi:hypothetical protein HMPREF9099_01344 [Lachnospiraceae bacterium oral taxon 082 str. F0431]|nr:hypothetical protein HMPREF9099_01344 [Lachnospiraceae bacterium oral taxon 082 str. F0431]